MVILINILLYLIKQDIHNEYNMLIVGVLCVELHIPGAESLKDKRSVVKSMLERSRNKFGVSSAEIEKLDSFREAVLAFSYLANDKRFVESVLRKVETYLESFPESEIMDSDIELIDI